MASIKLNDAEMQALYGLGYEAIALYVMAIRPRMDFATGMVGRSPRISWQALREWIYVEPRPGVKTSVPSIEAVRRIAAQLVKAGLLRVASTDTYLIFKAVLADTDKNVRNKADTKPTGYADRDADTRNVKPIKARTPEADTEAEGGQTAEADTHPGTGCLPTNTSSSTGDVSTPSLRAGKNSSPHPSGTGESNAPSGPYSAPFSAQRQRDATASGEENQLTGEGVVWPNGLEPANQAAMASELVGLGVGVQQTVLDEWRACTQAGGIKFPMRFFRKLVADAKAGTFAPDKAHEVAAARANRARLDAEQRTREVEHAAQVANGRTAPPGGSLKATLRAAGVRI